MKLRLPLLALLALVLAPATAWAQITPEDVANLRNVGNVSISPDGQHVAFTASTPRSADEAPGPSYNELFVVAHDGGEPVQITTRPQFAGSPRWAPDGRLAFVTRDAEQHAQAQVYAVAPAGGAMTRLTDSPEGVMAYAFSEDGSQIFYTARAAEDPELARLRERGYDQIVAGEGGRHIRLFVERTGGGERQMLTPEDMSVREFAVAPDARTVAVQMTEGTGIDDDMMFRQVFTVSVDGGAPARLAPSEGKLGMMAVSPDGRRVAYLSAIQMSDPLPHSIFVADVASRDSRNATPDLEKTIEWFTWEDEGTILFAAVEGTRTVVSRLDVDSGTITRVIGPGDEIVRAISVAGDGDRFAAAVNTRMYPNEVYVGSLASGEMTRITDHNAWIAERRMARQETIEWTGAEGSASRASWSTRSTTWRASATRWRSCRTAGPRGSRIDGWNTRALYPAHVMARRATWC
jgi:dipeptidyl aminopeptidase/acylaminoacyl peptidase